jgi:hypothetical protein
MARLKITLQVIALAALPFSGVMTGRLDARAISAPMPVAGEIDCRGVHLRRIGLELVGECPVCGDGGKGATSDRFAVHLSAPRPAATSADDSRPWAVSDARDHLRDSACSYR